MAEMMLLLKPDPFIVKSVGDSEQLYQDFRKYISNFQDFLTATDAAGVHADGHVNCGACRKANATLRLIGGDEMKSLFDHVGAVGANDTLDTAIQKIAEGIKQQTNQATARFKLFQQMPQGGQHFAEWYVKVKEQAARCVWTGYDAKSAARDAILYQTDSKTLTKKIIAEDLNLNDTIKYGLALEQGACKVEVIGDSWSRKEEKRVAALEEQVRALQAKGKSSESKITMDGILNDQRTPNYHSICGANGEGDLVVNTNEPQVNMEPFTTKIETEQFKDNNAIPNEQQDEAYVRPDIDSMIAAEQSNDKNGDGKSSSKGFWEKYCKRPHGVSPIYNTTPTKDGKFKSKITIIGKGSFKGFARPRKIAAEESAAYEARKVLDMLFDD